MAGAASSRRSPCVYDPGSGRAMDVLSTEPGVQFYTGNFLDGTITGKKGVVYRQYWGLGAGDAAFSRLGEPSQFPLLRPQGGRYLPLDDGLSFPDAVKRGQSAASEPALTEAGGLSGIMRGPLALNDSRQTAVPCPRPGPLWRLWRSRDRPRRSRPTARGCSWISAGVSTSATTGAAARAWPRRAPAYGSGQRIPERGELAQGRPAARLGDRAAL